MVGVVCTSENLVEEVADVVVAQSLRLQQLEHVCLHQALHDVDVLHLVDRGRPYYVSNVDYLLNACLTIQAILFLCFAFLCYDCFYSMLMLFFSIHAYLIHAILLIVHESEIQ